MLRYQTSVFECVEAVSPTIEPPAISTWQRGMVRRVILVLLAVGFVALLAVSVTSLVSGSERTLTFVSQDFPFDNTTVGAGLSKTFWLSAGESIRPELVERISNRSSGASIWEGPVYVLFLHYPLDESGPAFWPPYIAPRTGYFALEVHHHECQDEVDLCSHTTSNLTYATSGMVRVESPRPYPFLTPSLAVLTATGSATGLGLTSWRLARRRSRPSVAADRPKGDDWRPAIAAVLLVLAMVAVGSVGLDAMYRPQVFAQANGFGTYGFASDTPCVPGKANMMVLSVSAYNGADEPVTIWVEVRVAGAPDRVSGIAVTPHSIGSVGVGVYASTDCKDPAAQVRITGIWPSWS